ncbi:MAG TPA: ACT domain-containing protein [Phototrophicaceae bacterium]|jgi:hypothetical protein|nr:ACT domain-containing protein [Phototrophicaceae bacterium]
MHLRLLPELFGIAKLQPPQLFPDWLSQSPLFFIAQTEDEYSIMCLEHFIPETISCNRGYRCLRVDGDLAFDEIGVVARVSKPLADAGLSLFLVSTHDRDYVLVHQNDLTTALEIYREADFIVIDG